MTEQQKREIKAMRAQGQTSGQIAAALGISANTVKSFCRRQRQSRERCKNCGEPLVQVPGGRSKIFCTDKCRYAWWNRHRDQLQRKNIYFVACAGCGREFDCYGNRNRKYCSHACYIRSRYGDA